jgi:hypothetical protein
VAIKVLQCGSTDQIGERGVIYIATTVNGREYVVLVDGKVVAGPFVSCAEAVKVREKMERERGSVAQLPA